MGHIPAEEWVCRVSIENHSLPQETWEIQGQIKGGNLCVLIHFTKVINHFSYDTQTRVGMKTGSRNYPQNPTLQSVKMGKIWWKRRSPAQNPLSSGLQHEIRQENKIGVILWDGYIFYLHIIKDQKNLSLYNQYPNKIC